MGDIAEEGLKKDLEGLIDQPYSSAAVLVRYADNNVPGQTRVIVGFPYAIDSGSLC